MEAVVNHMDEITYKIKQKGYMIESKSHTENENAVFNISFYDSKHIAKYNFIGEIQEVGEKTKASLSVIFLSGIKEDFKKNINGCFGSIITENIGRASQCRIEYKISEMINIFSSTTVECILEELEDSIYNIKYRKYFAL